MEKCALLPDKCNQHAIWQEGAAVGELRHTCVKVDTLRGGSCLARMPRGFAEGALGKCPVNLRKAGPPAHAPRETMPVSAAGNTLLSPKAFHPL